MDVEGYIFFNELSKELRGEELGWKAGGAGFDSPASQPCYAVFLHLLGTGCAGGPQCIYRFGGESWRHAPGSLAGCVLCGKRQDGSLFDSTRKSPVLLPPRCR